MSLARDTFSQIEKITNSLIEVSLCDDQNSPVKRPSVSGWDTCKIEIPSKELAIALKNIRYEDMYSIMSEKRNFNFRLIDGALLVLQYDFEEGKLLRHTLAYYPNPDLISFQENEELYIEDEIYLDIIDKRIMSVPLRFDYDSREGVYIDVEHPKSHFTLGQFEKCRIPVSRPLTPSQFVHFILRNFYNTAYSKYKDRIFFGDEKFEETISDREKDLIHISL